MTVFFSNLSCYAKTGLKKTIFSNSNSEKVKYMFQKAHERIKDCIFFKLMCLSETNFLPENPKH